MRTSRPTGFAIKAAIVDLNAEIFAFAAHKTMYGGRNLSAGDLVFLFASENEGGAGLFARGVVTLSAPAPRTEAARQTPRLSVEVRRIDHARHRCGREQVRSFRDWSDGSPRTELNFKLYRQATNKIVGLSPTTVDYLNQLF